MDSQDEIFIMDENTFYLLESGQLLLLLRLPGFNSVFTVDADDRVHASYYFNYAGWYATFDVNDVPNM